MNTYKSKINQQSGQQNKQNYDKLLENLENIKITDEEQDQEQEQNNQISNQSIQNIADESNQENKNSSQLTFQQIQNTDQNVQKTQQNLQSITPQNANESLVSEPISHNDSGLFFVTNPNFKSNKKLITDEQIDKIQTNPEQYYDNYAEKVSQIKSEILRNQAQIQECKSLFKRLQIQTEADITKDTRQIEISIESFIKKLTYNLQDSDQEMRYLQKQIDQQLADDQPTIRCLDSFEKRVFHMEKEIGIVPEQYLTPEQMQQEEIRKIVFP